MKTLLAIAVVMGSWPSSGGAQALNDPTRPPPMFSADAPGETGAPGAPVLQSVKISPTERTAIIGGQRVGIGSRYGEARVVKITENEVVLRSAAGSETLHMYPGVSIKPAAPEPPAARKKPAPKAAARKPAPAAKTEGQQQ